MKVWILTARFGNGHFSAAKALEEEYQEQGHEVVVSDMIRILYPIVASLVYGLFNAIICRNSVIYNFANSFGRNPRREPNTPKRLMVAFEQIKPDLIITTWSGCGRKLKAMPVPIYVCITDIGVHAGWLCPYAKGYLVATEDVAEKLLKFGISRKKIQISGIPVKKVFYKLPYKVPKCKGEKNLLIMGGGLGILPWIDSLLAGLYGKSGLHITVITGKNQALFRRLRRKYPSVTVVGFVSDVPSYLAQADLLLSKPGGISLFESIYASTPFVAMLPSYLHELENSAFIQKREIGDVVWDEQVAAQQIFDLLQDDERRNRYQANIMQMRREVELARHRKVG